jgi:hypothetical protein
VHSSGGVFANCRYKQGRLVQEGVDTDYWSFEWRISRRRHTINFTRMAVDGERFPSVEINNRQQIWI